MPKIQSLVGKMLASKHRSKVLLALAESQTTPTYLEKQTGIKFSHISDVLKELIELKLITCVTPELRKGKLYAITKLGKQVAKETRRYSEKARQTPG